jgi:hypothetical protein
VSKIVPVGWIEGDWIMSSQPIQHLKYWIHEGRIWGPDGNSDLDTRYWIADGWILGPRGAPDVTTGYYVSGGWIYGPRFRLPFV